MGAKRSENLVSPASCGTGYIREQREDAGGQPCDASLRANGEHWDGASGYVGVGAGK